MMEGMEGGGWVLDWSDVGSSSGLCVVLQLVPVVVCCALSQ